MKTSLPLRHFLVLFALALPAFSLLAQDIHFSQFNNSPINLNPGLTGVFGGDLRFVGNYRRQWSRVPVPYTTISGTVEKKFFYDKFRYDRFLTGGVLLNYDRQGALELTSLLVGIPVSITLPLDKNKFLTLGITPAFGQRNFSDRHWTFDEQFVNGLYNPSAPTGEDGSLISTNIKYFDLSAGLNYHWQAKRKRSKFDVGAGLFHINRPNHDFWTNSKDVRLASRISLYGLGSVQVGERVDVVGVGQYQIQGGYRELVVGAGGRYLCNPEPYNELAFQGILGFRQRDSDALFLQVDAFWRTWTLGFSYDLNLSEFQQATKLRGGPEVSLIYRLYRPKTGPICPIE